MNYPYKVSIIIPVYNAEQYLPRCIDSILAQTLEDIEVILVDDGSSDSSGEICDGYAQLYSYIQVEHMENGGPARARNTGIDLAHGKYLGFVDADDMIVPDMYKQLWMEAERGCNDITLCGYDTVTKTGKREVIPKFKVCYEGNAQIREKLLSLYYTSGNKVGLFTLWNKLFSSKMIFTHGLRIDETLVRAEDAWFVFDCLKVAEKIETVPNAYYHYYQNEGSIMHSIRLDQYEKWVYTRKKLLEENENLGFEIDNHEFYRDFLMNTAGYCCRLLQIGYKDKVREILRDPFYRHVASYARDLPLHTRVLYRLVQNGSAGLSMVLLRVWAFVLKVR